MTIKEDVLTLKTKQDNYFAANGRYVQALKTPAVIPTIGDITTFTELNKPEYETVILAFTPTAKDYQFWIDVASFRESEENERFGYWIHVRRKLGDNVLEEIIFRKNIEDA